MRYGAVALESGAALSECTLVYRTRGELNAARSNAVVVLPWFQGTTRQLALQIGPGKLVDTSRFFVVLIDPLGNGVSSSPSNSRTQPNESFPRFTIGDLVDLQHRLVTEVLNLSRLKAVIGISMGGMQVFEWATRYPTVPEKAIAIVASPQTQPDDRRRWEMNIQRLDRTPWSLVRDRWPRLTWGSLFRGMWLRRHDQIRQAEAIMNHDVAAKFGGSLARAADVVRAELLVVGTWSDQEVEPGPAFAFAKLTGGRLIELDGRCGHQAPSCERERLWKEAQEFLRG